MNDAESWKDKWLCTESSTAKSENWTSSENVRLVAALTKCNPLKPNWRNVSELMKNQPEAKHRAANFFSPKNCCTQFQQIHNKYFCRNSGGCDIKLGCGASFPSDHLINILATEALLEKSQLLGKNSGAQSSTPNQSFTSDGSWGSASTTSSTLDIIPDAIFEDAVQYESPAESLSDDYFHFSAMEKNPKPVVSGPAAIARKSTPNKSQEFKGVRQDETRHFSTIDSFPDSTSSNSNPVKSPATSKKSQRNPGPSNASTNNSINTSSGEAPRPMLCTNVTPSSSKNSGFRTKKATRISEISDKLVAAAMTSNSALKTCSSLSSNSTLSSVPESKSKLSQQPVKKSGLGFLLGPDGNHKVLTLSEFQEQQRASRKLRLAARGARHKPENVTISQTPPDFQSPSTSTDLQQPPKSSAPVNRFLQPFKKPHCLKKMSMSPKADDHDHVQVLPLPIISTKGLKGDTLQTRKESSSPIERGGSVTINASTDIIQVEKNKNHFFQSEPCNKMANSTKADPSETTDKSDNHPEVPSVARGCGILPIPHLLPLKHPTTAANIDKEEIFQDPAVNISDDPIDSNVINIPEIKSNDTDAIISQTSYEKPNPLTSPPKTFNKKEDSTDQQQVPADKRVLRSSTKRMLGLAPLNIETEMTSNKDQTDDKASSSKSDEKLDTPGLDPSSSNTPPNSDLSTPPPDICTCQPHASHQVLMGPDSCPIHFQKSSEESKLPVVVPSPIIPEAELMFLFRQALAFSSDDFYVSGLVGYAQDKNTAIKKPMDLLTVLQMIKSGEIKTVKTLEKKLTMCYTHALIVHPHRHPIAKRAFFAITSLRRLISEYSTPEILHKRFSQFQENGVVLLKPEAEVVKVEVEVEKKKIKRPLSPDITDFRSRRKTLKIRKQKVENVTSL